MTSPERIAFTTGEPGGIGPELAWYLAQTSARETGGGCQLIAIGDRELLRTRLALFSPPLCLMDYTPQMHALPAPGTLLVCHVPLAAPARPGCLDPANAPYVLSCLDRAHQGCLNGEFDAMVTGPVAKSVIADYGITFTGHTEYLQQRCNAAQVIMMLGCRELKVALATTHLPLHEVCQSITAPKLHALLTLLDRELRTKFALTNPSIFVSALNPHAGEQGHLGHEEQEIIIPVLRELRQQGLNLTGPLPADTLFIPPHMQQADVFVTMYHDQGLPVLKYIGFGRGYNVTLGLPYIRTSVDHGVALELAGTAKADPGSLYAALHLARDMLRRRRG